jgi:hypothetical protein
MTTQVITPAEAWQEVERLKACVDYNRVAGKWCAATSADKWHLGWGATPLEAVGQLLSRIAEAATKAEAVNA